MKVKDAQGNQELATIIRKGMGYGVFATTTSAKPAEERNDESGKVGSPLLISHIFRT
jgi:hypothetical protein